MTFFSYLSLFNSLGDCFVIEYAWDGGVDFWLEFGDSEIRESKKTKKG